jgi:hypothetical protein
VPGMTVLGSAWDMGRPTTGRLPDMSVLSLPGLRRGDLQNRPYDLPAVLPEITSYASGFPQPCFGVLPSVVRLGEALWPDSNYSIFRLEYKLYSTSDVD